ncbi:hypothetical protein HDU96_007602 [Phlyctochytrium bullatum]|nr:hypothetical protein HDU96_007602 [Phlyctochytrium bullatum]
MDDNSSRPRPAVLLRHASTPHPHLLVTPPATSTEHAFTSADLRRHTLDTLAAFLNTVCPNPARLVYALASRAFTSRAVRPLGGRQPEYIEYAGSTPEDLLEFVVEKAVAPPTNGRGRKRVEPGECLAFVAEQLNEVVRKHREGYKDEVDNEMLLGMEKAGHIRGGARIVIPEDLRDGARASKPLQILHRPSINLATSTRQQRPFPAAAPIQFTLHLHQQQPQFLPPLALPETTSPPPHVPCTHSEVTGTERVFDFRDAGRDRRSSSVGSSSGGAAPRSRKGAAKGLTWVPYSPESVLGGKRKRNKAPVEII